MHMLPRTLWHLWFVGPRGRRIGFEQVSRSRFRVWPTDLDVLRHMNNGKYLSIMDVARFDMMQRTDTLRVFKEQEWYPVVVNQTITYRRSLNPWQRFWIETRILGFDEQALYVEQRFVRPDAQRRPEVYARAYVRARILRRSGGVVPVDEIIEKTGADPERLRVPDAVREWGLGTRLPSTRVEAISRWE